MRLATGFFTPFHGGRVFHGRNSFTLTVAALGRMPPNVRQSHVSAMLDRFVPQCSM